MREVAYNHSATVMLPEELYHIIWKFIQADIPVMRYAKVIMKLEDVLNGEFFTRYLKKGEIDRATRKQAVR